jgi:hypothetical protein
MNTVTLMQEGTIAGEKGQAVADPLACLGCQVVLGPGYSLRSFFRMLEKFRDLQRLNEFLPACVDRYRRSPASGCRWEAFEHLALSKTVEMIGFPGDPRLEIYISFHGVSGGQPGELKFVPFEHLIDMPVVLGRLKHVVFGDRVDVFEFDTVYILFELIDGIGWELGFQGTPLECKIGR